MSGRRKGEKKRANRRGQMGRRGEGRKANAKVNRWVRREGYGGKEKGTDTQRGRAAGQGMRRAQGQEGERAHLPFRW